MYRRWQEKVEEVAEGRRVGRRRQWRWPMKIEKMEEEVRRDGRRR